VEPPVVDATPAANRAILLATAPVLVVHRHQAAPSAVAVAASVEDSAATMVEVFHVLQPVTSVVGRTTMHAIVRLKL